MCSAFATLLRRIVFDIDQGDEHWLNSLAKAGFTQEDITHIYDFVKHIFFIMSILGRLTPPAIILFLT